MRVLFLQQQPCARARKYAAGLRSARGAHLRLGFAYRGATLSSLYGSGDELFDRWWRLDADPAAELHAVLEEFRPDVIHSHNLPDSLTVLALELTDGRAPVVHDVHDLQSLRKTPYEDGFPAPDEPLELERRAVEGCAALVTVSGELLAQIRGRYKVLAPTLIFPNYALGRDLPPAFAGERPLGRRPRLVYQGTLSTNGGHYDLRDLFRAIGEQRFELHVYPSRPVDGYDAIGGVRMHETLAPSALLRELPRYDLGWAGFNATLNAAHLDTALPNKAFEYIGCGLPVLTLGHGALSRFLAERGLGVTLESVDDLAGELREIDLPALRRRVAAARDEFTIESRIGAVLALYEAVAHQWRGAPASGADPS
jgi:glycosyltransferase involved in cell wall biosynthesis